MNKIPIVIGVTGHRDLRDQDIPKLEEIVRDELKERMNSYPNSPFLMISSLAEGADQLCARVAIELGIKIVCALPRELDEFKNDFRGDALADFEECFSYAKDYFVVPDIESRDELNLLKDSLSHEDFARKVRHFGYRQAGIYVAINSHILLALHDGSAHVEGGVGTSEAIDFKLNHNYNDEEGLFKTVDGGAVIQIKTPREKNPNIENPLTVNSFPPKNCLKDVLNKTNEFNKDIESISNPPSSHLFDEDIIEESTFKTRKIAKIKAYSGKLSRSYKDRYTFNLKLYSILAFSIVFAFMFYDQVKSNLAMIIYTGILIFAVSYLYIVIKKQDVHRKSLDYRVLSECLRTQFYLTLLNIKHDVYEGLTWIQKNDTPWIHLGIKAILIGGGVNQHIDMENVKEKWIDDQLDYHNNAYKKTVKLDKRNSYLTKTFIILSLALGVLMLFLELFFGNFVNIILPISGSIKPYILFQENGLIFIRDIFKILFVLFSAFTLLLSNYYGKLSLSRKIADHKNMIKLFKSAKEQFEKEKINKEKLFIELAIEEIVENGNWLSYSKDNTIDISI